MRIINNYIGRTIIGTTAIIFIALISMDFFIQLMNEVGEIGHGNYGMAQALLYVLLVLPRDIYQLFPMVGLIGCLMGLGILAGNSELVVMRAAGVSLWQITRAVLMAIILMVFFVTILGEAISPQAIFYAESLKASERSGGQAMATKQGIWLRDGSDFVHIKAVEMADQLIGVTRYQFNQQHRLTNITYADKAVYQHKIWQLQNISASIINPDNTVSVQKQDAAQWKMHLNPDVLKVAQIDADEMSINKLYELIQYRKQNGLRYNTVSLSFWQRIFQPLATCVMMLLAIPFIFGPLRSATMGLRLVAGIIVGFSFYILNQLFGPISIVYMFPPILAAIVPMLLFAGVGVWFMRRMG